jgi:D-alanyl-D-alanine-carboxypeptidase/D-alanyl-D-alanine-endopeptidase
MTRLFRHPDPFGILTAIILASIPTPAATQTPAVAAFQPARTLPSNAAIRALLAERMQRNGVGIVVGIIEPEGRRIIAYGRTGGTDARALDGDAVFQIGSLTKPFTALLLADMVVRGEVRLDDAAADYLPTGVRMPRRGRAITLRDLATHISGLPSMPTNFPLNGRPDPYEAYTVDDLYRFLSTYTPEREPGVRSEYSNLGVALLGHLLARRAGTDYETLLSQRILQPLGMTNSAIRLDARLAQRELPGHDRYLRPVRTWEMRVMPGSGSLRSTANDMLNFLAAYLGYGGATLRDAMELQLRERIPSGTGAQALGWFVRSDGLAAHAGGKQGYRSAAIFDPATRRGVVVLANSRTYDEPIDLARHLLAGTPLAPAPDAPAPRTIVPVETGLLDRYAGRYRLPSGDVLEVARRDSHLLLHRPGQGISEFFATGPSTFFLDTGNDEIEFRIEAARVTGLNLYPDGREGEAELAVRVTDQGATGRQETRLPIRAGERRNGP